MASSESTKADAGQDRATLEMIKAELSRIHHQLNNPLAVISGNVELLQELAGVLGVNEDFQGPLEDIVQAAEQLADTSDQLMVTRNLIAQLNS